MMMKKHFMMTMLLMLMATVAMAQHNRGNAGKDKVYDVVEVMPQFPGGQVELLNFLSDNVKYPADAEKKKIEGRVIATFVVDKDGSITDAEIVRSVYPSLDAEALRVINAMPKWVPGRHRGSPVRVKYTVPLTFSLK